MTGVFPPDIRRCAHRKTNGIPCGSPALKDKPYCYFHDRWREQHIDVLDGTPFYQNVETDLPILEDANSIQMALTKVFHMLLAGLLEPRFARSLTYCLSMAAQNLPRCNFAPKDEELRDNAPARADQSIGQSTYAAVSRPEKDGQTMSAHEKHDAAITAKKPAEDVPNPEETVDLKTAPENKNRHPDRSEAMAGPSCNSVDGLAVPEKSVAKQPHAERARTVSRSSERGMSEVSNKSQPDYETILARVLNRQLTPRKIKLDLPKPHKNAPGLRGPAKENEPTKKKPKPATNLFDRLAQRREEHKKREGIM